VGGSTKGERHGQQSGKPNELRKESSRAMVHVQNRMEGEAGSHGKLPDDLLQDDRSEGSHLEAGERRTMKTLQNLKQDLEEHSKKQKLDALSDGEFLKHYDVTENEIENLFEEIKNIPKVKLYSAELWNRGSFESRYITPNGLLEDLPCLDHNYLWNTKDEAHDALVKEASNWYDPWGVQVAIHEHDIEENNNEDRERDSKTNT
jgi:transposase